MYSTTFRLFLILTGFITGISTTVAGQAKKALFIGNSLTYFNDMPQTVKAIGTALGDSLDVTVYAPGGTGFVHHHVDPTVYQHFSQGDWDYIILQPGSNESPAFSAPIDSTLRWGKMLTDSARFYNPCAQLWLYEISYGVSNASAQANTNYYFAQSLIQTNLLTLGDSLHTGVVPAGEVMRNIWSRDTSFLIWGSFGDIHPNAYGSYAIACAFAASIFKKPNVGLPYYNGLDSIRCKVYQRIADSIVGTTPALWNTGVYFPSAKFTFNKTGNQVNFQNQSLYYDQLSWSFGDGTTSQQTNPSKTYTAAGSYAIHLKAYKDSCYDEYATIVETDGSGTGIHPAVAAMGITVYPNPAKDHLVIEQKADRAFTFSVYSIAGVRILQQEIIRQHHTIDISSLSPGMYLYTVSSGVERQSGKLIKQ